MSDEKLNDTQEAIRERLANVGRYHRHMPILIHEAEDLAFFANEAGTRIDWHEPDEQDLTARTAGHSFDNAGFWCSTDLMYSPIEEQHVVLCVNEYPVAAVNLATLFAWATDQRRDWSLPEPPIKTAQQRAAVLIKRMRAQGMIKSSTMDEMADIIMIVAKFLEDQ